MKKSRLRVPSPPVAAVPRRGRHLSAFRGPLARSLGTSPLSSQRGGPRTAVGAARGRPLARRGQERRPLPRRRRPSLARPGGSREAPPGTGRAEAAAVFTTRRGGDAGGAATGAGPGGGGRRHRERRAGRLRAHVPAAPAVHGSDGGAPQPGERAAARSGGASCQPAPPRSGLRRRGEGDTPALFPAGNRTEKRHSNSK